MGELVLYMVKYENDQKAAMLTDEAKRDRAAIHRQAITDFGGRPIAQYGSYGEYDIKALAANLHLTDSFGLAKYAKAIPLMEAGDFVASLALAHETPTEYGPAKG